MRPATVWRHATRVLVALGAAAAGLTSACSSDPVGTGTPPANPPARAAAAVAPTLTWLAPLGTGTADAAAFDAAAAPRVEVCAWTGAACADAPVARFATTPAAGELALTVNAAAGRYEAAWSLASAAFTTRATYRIRVLQGATELGALSVDVVRGRWALARTDGTQAPLVAATALPIWFAVSSPPSSPPPSQPGLTVVLGPGVQGTPAAGTTAYPVGTRVGYALATLPGYRHLRVQVDSADADTAGAITIAAAHTLFATADRIPVVSDQAQPVVPLARALVTARDAAGARRAADAFTAAARALYETLGPGEARRQLAEISALTFDPVRDSAALRRTTELLAQAGPVSYRVTAGGGGADRAALHADRAASVAGADAAARPTTVIFVNGVLNSPKDGMQSLLEVDRLAVEAGLLAQSGGDLKMQHFYNASWLGDPMAGPFNCLMGVGVDELSGQLTRKLEGEKCSGGLLGILEVATQYAAGLLATSRLTVPQARLLADRIHNEVDAGRKVLVVAHSQGNLMAQQATRLLEETLPPSAMKCVAVTSIAPPVTTNWPQVVWTGVYAKGARTNDILLDVLRPRPVTTMVRTNVTDAADARVNAIPFGFQTLYSFYEDGKLHALVPSYMAGDNTRRQIRDDLAQSAGTLEAQCRDTVVVRTRAESLYVTPLPVKLRPGEWYPLLAAVYGPTGLPIPGRSVAWESLDPRVASFFENPVNATIRAFGVMDGRGTLRATSGSAHADVPVVVSSPPSGFNFQGSSRGSRGSPCSWNIPNGPISDSTVTVVASASSAKPGETCFFSVGLGRSDALTNWVFRWDTPDIKRYISLEGYHECNTTLWTCGAVALPVDPGSTESFTLIHLWYCPDPKRYYTPVISLTPCP